MFTSISAEDFLDSVAGVNKHIPVSSMRSQISGFDITKAGDVAGIQALYNNYGITTTIVGGPDVPINQYVN